MTGLGAAWITVNMYLLFVFLSSSYSCALRVFSLFVGNYQLAWSGGLVDIMGLPGAGDYEFEPGQNIFIFFK